MPDTQTTRPGRNEPCPCGSGKKYKHCCRERDEEEDRARRAEEAKEAAAVPATEDEHTQHTETPHRHDAQPWKRGTANTKGFRTFSGPRKVGGG